jgi:hypothetical protein
VRRRAERARTLSARKWETVRWARTAHGRKRSFTSVCGVHVPAAMVATGTTISAFAVAGASVVDNRGVVCSTDPDPGRSTRLRFTLGLLRETPRYLRRLRASAKAKARERVARPRGNVTEGSEEHLWPFSRR